MEFFLKEIWCSNLTKAFIHTMTLKWYVDSIFH